MNRRTFADRSLAWNAGALFIAQLSGPILGAGLIVVLARELGPELLGAYSLLVTAFLVLDQFRLLGLHRFLTRELAARHSAAISEYKAFCALAHAGTAIAAMLLVGYGLRARVELAVVFSFAAGFLPSAVAWANDAVFLGYGRADYTARVTVIENLVRIVLSVGVLWLLGPNLVALGCAYTGARTVTAIVGSRYRRQLIGVHTGWPSWRAVTALVSHAPDFFAVTTLPLLLLRADVLVVGWLATAHDVGLYTAAARLVSVMVLLPDSLMVANFVRIARSRATGDRRLLRRQIGVVLLLTLAVLVPVSAGVSVLARLVAVTVYGAGFAGAATYLSWLVWSVPLFAMSRAVGDALVAWDYQRRMAVVIALSVIISGPLYWLLFVVSGPFGAALAYLSSIVVLLILSMCAAGPLFFDRSGSRHGAFFGAGAAAVPLETD